MVGADSNVNRPLKKSGPHCRCQMVDEIGVYKLAGCEPRIQGHQRNDERARAGRCHADDDAAENAYEDHRQGSNVDAGTALWQRRGASVANASVLDEPQIRPEPSAPLPRPAGRSPIPCGSRSAPVRLRQSASQQHPTERGRD
jgi:hypothetical protein